MIPPEWLNTSGEGVRVGVIDTGFSKEIAAKIVECRTFVPSPLEENTRHGTEMVKIIASNNPVDEGLAPLAEIVYAKAIHQGQSTARVLVQALEWLATSNCQVINMSFAMSNTSQSFRDLVQVLDEQGKILVAAYAQEAPYPHSLPGVIQVGMKGSPAMVNTNGFLPSVSIAPKVGWLKGSSVASAIISGVAACAKSYDHTIDRSLFLQRLRTGLG